MGPNPVSPVALEEVRTQAHTEGTQHEAGRESFYKPRRKPQRQLVLLAPLTVDFQLRTEKISLCCLVPRSVVLHQAAPQRNSVPCNLEESWELPADRGRLPGPSPELCCVDTGRCLSSKTTGPSRKVAHPPASSLSGREPI